MHINTEKDLIEGRGGGGVGKGGLGVPETFFFLRQLGVHSLLILLAGRATGKFQLNIIRQGWLIRGSKKAQ